jgi:hypothetical protein
MPVIPREWQEFADSLAELKTNASVSAQSTFNVMILDLLIRKGVITRDELFQRLTDIETNAGTFQGASADYDRGCSRSDFELKKRV